MEAENELDKFREQWRAEVVRNKRQEAVPIATQSSSGRSETPKEAVTSLPPAVQPAGRRKDASDFSEEVEPKAYHDLPDKEDQLKLGNEEQRRAADFYSEPSSALEHYERAVEKETHGQLGDSMSHYRKAFKLDDGVHEAYKKKHFPPSSFVKAKPTNPNPSNAPVTVPHTGHHSLHGSNGGLSTELKQLLDDFSAVRIEAAPPVTNISPQEPCYLAQLPQEILSYILSLIADTDFTALTRVGFVCKRFAYLTLTEQSVWKNVAMSDDFGFTAMHYDFACDIEGFSLEANDEIARYLGSYDELDEDKEPPPTPEERAVVFSAITEELLHSTYTSSWRQMFRSRPRIRFNGCYISTVNYTRPGATSSNTLTWGVPVHVVTYFRYLRFFRDGTVISLLTTAEPSDVVHHLIKENLHDHHHSANLPSRVMKDALRGRWRLAGPASSVADPVIGTAETEGDVHVETEGVVPKYTYKMLLALAHAGKGTRNNKLAWKGFWSYNRLTDDWGEFGLKNDRAYYWSRVRSYGV